MHTGVHGVPRSRVGLGPGPRCALSMQNPVTRRVGIKRRIKRKKAAIIRGLFECFNRSITCVDDEGKRFQTRRSAKLLNLAQESC